MQDILIAQSFSVGNPTNSKFYKFKKALKNPSMFFDLFFMAEC